MTERYFKLLQVDGRTADRQFRWPPPGSLKEIGRQIVYSITLAWLSLTESPARSVRMRRGAPGTPMSDSAEAPALLRICGRWSSVGTDIRRYVPSIVPCGRKEAMSTPTVICRSCHDEVPLSEAHGLDGLWVCSRCDPPAIPDQPEAESEED